MVLEDIDLEDILDENATQSIKELPTSENLAVDESTVSRRLHTIGKIQKEGKWLSCKLSENPISNRFNIEQHH